MESSTEWFEFDVMNTTVNDSVNPLELLQGSTSGVGAWMTFNLFLYALICAAGVVGNVLVIYVVLRYKAMRNSVTNTYIINLAVSDFCFLVGLPFLIVTVIQRSWVFGLVVCKLFYILTALNWFTSVFTLTVMSADRYLAVCHAIESRRYRTPFISRVVCGIVWIVSLLVMMPIYLYSRTVEYEGSGSVSCTITWPDDQMISPDKAFVWYAFCLSFAIPVPMISVFYFLVVARLGKVGPNKQSKGKKKSQRKVTTMVLAVITVYVICWLPYWLFQHVMLFIEKPPYVVIQLYQLITVLSYANSTLNPVLYAFLSENFRKTFSRAFGCTTADEVDRILMSKTRKITSTPPIPAAGGDANAHLLQQPKDNDDVILAAVGDEDGRPTTLAKTAAPTGIVMVTEVV